MAGRFSARRSKNAGSSNDVRLRPYSRLIGLEIDRNGQQLAVDRRLNAMLILPPLGEARQILEHIAAVGVKDVGPVLVHEHARIVVMVVRIAADVVALVDDEHRLAGVCCETLCHDAACESGSDNEVVKHRFSSHVIVSCGYARASGRSGIRDVQRPRGYAEMPTTVDHGTSRPTSDPRTSGRRKRSTFSRHAGGRLTSASSMAAMNSLGVSSNAHESVFAVRAHDVP